MMKTTPIYLAPGAVNFAHDRHIHDAKILFNESLTFEINTCMIINTPVLVCLLSVYQFLSDPDVNTLAANKNELAGQSELDGEIWSET